MKRRASYEDAAAGHKVRSGLDLVSAIGAGVRDLVHPGPRKKIATGMRAESARARRPERDPGASLSPMDAGLTGGMTLLHGGGDRRRR